MSDEYMDEARIRVKEMRLVEIDPPLYPAVRVGTLSPGTNGDWLVRVAPYGEEPPSKGPLSYYVNYRTGGEREGPFEKELRGLTKEYPSPEEAVAEYLRETDGRD